MGGSIAASHCRLVNKPQLLGAGHTRFTAPIKSDVE
jgi:hypothetical protein